MNIKMFFFAAFVITISTNCDNNVPSSNHQTDIVIDTSNKVVEAPKDFVQIIVTQAIYQNAIVYGASTDYYFENESTGETIQFRNSNLEEEATVKMPDNMLQESEDGPPEANKALIGKLFIIHTIEDVITEVQLEENYDYDMD